MKTHSLTNLPKQDSPSCPSYEHFPPTLETVAMVTVDMDNLNTSLAINPFTAFYN